MKIRVIASALAIAIAGFSASLAGAATFGTIGPDNEALAPLGLTNPLSGYFGANLYLIGSNVTIRATVLGQEAGYNNRFSFYGQTYSSNNLTTFENDSNGVAQFLQSGLSSGLLDFWFGANSALATLSATNGTNADNSSASIANFFVSFLPNATATFGQSVLLFLDDGAGGTSDNHDDLVVRLDIVGGHLAPVPVPAAGLLLLGALGGLAAIRRRRQSV
ncbi:MAG: sorting domain protein [Cypionkella sp.]|uniref:VPLPA-CTERM sorting domain-containing protein n=1 Tax=Cypionkella sp. TaxID=2811411 RepID=UPI0026176F85|nr:VPLPA-CTERM sorting domain-containing protein [Cypionkella sp.]MDB5659138.1 sorting domain protein [Cypionkella sp.]